MYSLNRPSRLKRPGCESFKYMNRRSGSIIAAISVRQNMVLRQRLKIISCDHFTKEVYYSAISLRFSHQLDGRREMFRLHHAYLSHITLSCYTSMLQSLNIFTRLHFPSPSLLLPATSFCSIFGSSSLLQVRLHKRQTS